MRRAGHEFDWSTDRRFHVIDAPLTLWNGSVIRSRESDCALQGVTPAKFGRYIYPDVDRTCEGSDSFIMEYIVT